VFVNLQLIKFDLLRVFIEAMMSELAWVFLKNDFQNLNDSFVSKIVPIIKEYFQVDWFKNQTTSWNTYYQPEFTEVLTKRGFGFAFNMLPNSKLFTDRYLI
jgi:mannose/fructose/N-acetylgalactosamine-specific phosphotransferase system component IID